MAENTNTIIEPVGTKRFLLKALQGPVSGKLFSLIGREIRLGRNPTNDIVIDDPNLSRNHAVFFLTPSGFMIRDCNSRNGIYVNSTKVVEQDLKNQDFLMIGDSEFQFLEVDDSAEPIAPEPSKRISLAPVGAIRVNWREWVEKIPGPYRLPAAAGAAVVILFVILLSRPSQKKVRKNELPSPEITAPAPREQPTDTISGELAAEIYLQCLDLEELGLLNRAGRCFMRIPTHSGAKEGYERVIRLQTDLSRQLYTEGQQLFEVGYYERAYERWSRVIDLASEESEYYRLATKGIALIEERRKKTH